jgi:hypothetical protein
MTIWLLALVLLASLAGLGYRQGAIRVAFSFVAILLGAVLAVPLGRPMGKVLGLVGVKDPVLVWALGPVIVFVVISIIFKVAAASVHHKVDVFYKYKAGDLRLALWERLNHRLGLCLGLLNGAAYFVLLAFCISIVSYATTQVGGSDQDPLWMRLTNRMGADLQSTGFNKVARSVDSIPQQTYDMVDFGALVYRNPLCQARLRNYPGFLDLAEQPPFQDLGGDKEFTETWAQVGPIMSLLNHPRVLAIRENPDLLRTIWATVAPHLPDLRSYLATGESAKYDAIRILGRWKFDVNGAVIAMRRAKPNIFSSELQKVRAFLDAALGKAALVAKPDQQVILKNVPGVRIPLTVPPPTNLQTVTGQWKEVANKYQLSFSGAELPATVEGGRLTIKNEGLDWVFIHEE